MPSEKVQKTLDLNKHLTEAITSGAPIETQDNLKRLRRSSIEEFDIPQHYEYQLNITAEMLKLDIDTLDGQIAKDAQSDDPTKKFECLMDFKSATLSLTMMPIGFLPELFYGEEDDAGFDIPAPPQPGTLQ